MSEHATLLSLPVELRNQIFSYIFPNANHLLNTFHQPSASGGITLNSNYLASDALALLLTCRLFYTDYSTLLYSRTTFVINDIYSHLSTRLAVLRPIQAASIRHLSWVVGTRQFRELVQWRTTPFSFPLPADPANLILLCNLTLDTLNIVLHRSSNYLFLSDFTSDLVSLLRRLTNVKHLSFVRNRAHVKGHFKTWYNRLIGLMLKVDHQQRYDRDPPVLESTWWTWSYNDLAETFKLSAVPPKPIMEEEEYMLMIKPLVDDLMRRMESEEWDPDPRSRIGFG